jgi:hypothetical protein
MNDVTSVDSTLIVMLSKQYGYVTMMEAVQIQAILNRSRDKFFAMQRASQDDMAALIKPVDPASVPIMPAGEKIEPVPDGSADIAEISPIKTLEARLRAADAARTKVEAIDPGGSLDIAKIPSLTGETVASNITISHHDPAAGQDA